MFSKSAPFLVETARDFDDLFGPDTFHTLMLCIGDRYDPNDQTTIPISIALRRQEAGSQNVVSNLSLSERQSDRNGHGNVRQ